MNWTIQSISEVFDVKAADIAPWLPKHNIYDGYAIQLKREILVGSRLEKTFEFTAFVLIENQQSCCEQFGVVVSEDELKDFIGSRLVRADITDTELKTMQAPAICEGSVIFVTFLTTKGSFQFALYNQHNGYYGHNAVVITPDMKHQELL